MPRLEHVRAARSGEVGSRRHWPPYLRSGGPAPSGLWITWSSIADRQGAFLSTQLNKANINSFSRVAASGAGACIRALT